MPGKPPKPDGARAVFLARLGLVLAFIPCCPATGLLGAFLGLFALRRLPPGAEHARHRRVAITAVIAGIAMSVLWLVLFDAARGAMLEQYETDMTKRVEDFLAVEAEPETLAKSWTARADARVPVEEMLALRSECTARWGAFERFSLVSFEGGGTLFRPRYDVAGLFHFEHATLSGVARLDVMPSPSRVIVPEFRLRSITIEDHEQGDLVLPAKPDEPVAATVPDAASSGSG
jgi:hypothetical protein